MRFVFSTIVSGLVSECFIRFIFSTISSGLNSLSAVTLTDIIRPNVPDMSESRATTLTKVLGIYRDNEILSLLFFHLFADTVDKYNYKF